MAVRNARAITEEVECSVSTLSKVTLSNSERDVHRISSRFKLTLPIPLSEEPIGEDTVHYLKFSDWARFLLSKNLWSHLCGLQSPDDAKADMEWNCFWTRYRLLDPSHPIFTRTDLDLSRTCALVLHGDEGRGLKKSAILVVSVHSILGYGMSTTCKTARRDLNHLNYRKSTWITRFLLGVLPKHAYTHELDGEEEEPEQLLDVFQRLLQVLTEDLNMLWEHGIESPLDGKKYWFVVLRTMGDWPWLVKCGSLKRSFYNASKRSTGGSIPKGCCHQCLADRPGVKWEDFESEIPPWVGTMGTESPFDGHPPLLTLAYGHKPEEFFAYDLFHSWHVGLGKTLMATCMVLLASSDLFEGSVDTRFEALSEEFLRWCKVAKCQPYIRKLSKQNMGWNTAGTFPNGSWSKGSTTRVLGKFFLAFCDNKMNEVITDRYLYHAYQTAFNVESFLRGVYSWEVWIPRSKVEDIVSFGLGFLKMYGRGASMAFRDGRALFLLTPNLHRFHHLVWDLKVQSEVSSFALSPLVVSAQPDEDLVGRPSRISRRVSCRQTTLRTLQRSLIAARAAYRKSGLMV